MAPYSLTQTLLFSDPRRHQRATQSPFLHAAANGTLSKQALGTWLANDRLYIHSYIRGLGRLISLLDFPATVSTEEPVTSKLLSWCVGALSNIQREEKFFVDTALQYGIEVNLKTQSDGQIPDSGKLKGLICFEKLFSTVPSGPEGSLPWLEAAIVFWATEKCYLDAWSWAKSQTSAQRDPTADADGGAVRKEFINNWTSQEFVDFVDQLGRLIDEAVREQVKSKGDGVKDEFLRRAGEKWKEVLFAEESFWPAV